MPRGQPVAPIGAKPGWTPPRGAPERAPDPAHTPPAPAPEAPSWQDTMLSVLRDIRAELAAARQFRDPVFTNLSLSPGAAPTRFDFRGYKHAYVFVAGTPALLTNMLGQPSAYTLTAATWTSLNVPDGTELSVAAGGSAITGVVQLRDTPLP